MVSADVELGGPGWRMQARLTAPVAPVTRRQMLPLVRSLSDAAVDIACQGARDQGQPVSCKLGCAACCRQAVIVAPEEARLLRDLVEAMPEPRRSTVKARFAEIVRRLEEAGLRPKMETIGSLPPEEVSRLGLAYFHLYPDCPFLEDEACSIYEERPLACREYLVISPAEHCSNLSAHTIKQLRLPFKTTTAYARLGEEQAERVSPWMLLTLALEWAEDHPTETPSRPGPEWVRLLLGNLTGKAVPPAPPAP
jgi:Fe-S-cluster containining protein